MYILLARSNIYELIDWMTRSLNTTENLTNSWLSKKSNARKMKKRERNARKKKNVSARFSKNNAEKKKSVSQLKKRLVCVKKKSSWKLGATQLSKKGILSWFFSIYPSIEKKSTSLSSKPWNQTNELIGKTCSFSSLHPFYKSNL